MTSTEVSLLIASLVVVSLAGGTIYYTGLEEGDETTLNENFTIACWNLKIFGDTKAGKEDLLDYYAEKLDDYDLFIVQEIRDKDGDAITKLAAKLPAYDYEISRRAGYTSSKEQYAVFYNHRAAYVGDHDWTPERQSDFNRPPYQITFAVESWTFTIFTIHTTPSDVPNELRNLESIVGTPEGDTIIIGDLNADGTYYNEDNIRHFSDWHWKIENDMDTTVAGGSEKWTYDRIIINDAANDNYVGVGIMDDVVDEQSDHYLVWAEFDPSEDVEPIPPVDRPVINEFEVNPEGADSGNEWVEIYNPNINTIDLTGWALANNDDELYTFSGTIEPGEYVIISFTGSWLDNSNERLILYDDSFVEIDSTPIISDGSNNANTWQRLPDGTDTDLDEDWVFQTGTYGYSNSGEHPPQIHLLINEFEQNPEGSDANNEWAELYNPTNNAIDLTGWTLVNNDDDVHLLTGTVNAGGYLTITFTGSWLDNSDEGIFLFDAGDQQIDSTPIKADSYNDHRTWQRIPDGEDWNLDNDWAFQPDTMGYSND
jgi:hypothetical protein